MRCFFGGFTGFESGRSGGSLCIRLTGLDTIATGYPRLGRDLSRGDSGLASFLFGGGSGSFPVGAKIIDFRFILAHLLEERVQIQVDGLNGTDEPVHGAGRCLLDITGVQNQAF